MNGVEAVSHRGVRLNPKWQEYGKSIPLGLGDLNLSGTSTSSLDVVAGVMVMVHWQAAT